MAKKLSTLKIINNVILCGKFRKCLIFKKISFSAPFAKFHTALLLNTYDTMPHMILG